MANNPFSRGFFGDLNTGMAGGFEKGMGQGLDLFKALSTFKLAEEQAKVAAAQNQFTQSLGLHNMYRDDAKYAHEMQAANDKDIFGGSNNNITPYGGLPTNQGTGFPTAPFPQVQQPINQGQQVQPQQPAPLTPQQELLLKYPNRNPSVKPRSENHSLWAAQHRETVTNSAISPTRKKNLLDRIDRLEGQGTPDTLNPFDAEISKAIEDSKLTPEGDKELKELSLFEQNLVNQAALYNQSEPGLTGAGKYTSLDAINPATGTKITKPGSIERGSKLTSLARQGKYGPLEHIEWNWNKLKTPTSSEIKYKDQYEQTVQSLSNAFAKGDKGLGEVSKINAREWLADPNLDSRDYREAFQGDIEDAKTLIRETKKQYDEKFDTSAYKDLGSKLDTIDLSTPKKANAVIKSMVEQGIPPTTAKQLVKKEVVKQSQQKKTETQQRPLNRKTMSITMPNPTVKGGTEIVLPRSNNQGLNIDPMSGEAIIDPQTGQPIQAPESYINNRGEKKRGYAPLPPAAKFINQLPPTEANARKLALTIVRPGSQGMRLISPEILDKLDPKVHAMVDRALEMIETGEVA